MRLRFPSRSGLAAFAFATLVTLVAACAAEAPPAPVPLPAPLQQEPPALPPVVEPAVAAQPTVDDVRAFLTGVDADLRRIWTQGQRASWVNETYITDDTEAVSAAAEEANMEYLNRTIKAATRFDPLRAQGGAAGALPADLSRQLLLLKLASPLPAPSDPKERADLAAIEIWMAGAYGKGKYCPPRLKGKCLSLGELSNIMASSHKYDELLDAWTGWHAIAPPMRPKFQRYVELGNKGAKEIGFDDLGALWRSGYDMPPDQFVAETERLWGKVKPLYDELHCYVRSRLRKTYGKDRIGEKAPIPAHLLGNMWAQEWGNVYPLVEPYKGQGELDASKALKQKKYDPKQMVRLGEKFFMSLGLDPLPDTFWERSLFKKPADRDVVCHASAWDVTFDDDLRIKMCIEPKAEDLTTIHHELGHDYYYHSYYKLPILFQQGANDGFHEGIGDTIALSVTPAYLKGLGLLEKVPAALSGGTPPPSEVAGASGVSKAEIDFLLKEALDKVAFLPFGLLIDEWRWDVFSGKTPASDYNKAWWALRLKYQGVAPPVARSESDFDPGAKFHVPGNTPYMRYFLARIYQFQFHRALCRAAGYKGPLDACSIYGSKEAGAKLRAMLEMGASRPWPEAMKALSGETESDPGALLEYFEPLRKWLKEQNKGEVCGW